MEGVVKALADRPKQIHQQICVIRQDIGRQCHARYQQILSLGVASVVAVEVDAYLVVGLAGLFILKCTR